MIVLSTVKSIILTSRNIPRAYTSTTKYEAKEGERREREICNEELEERDADNLWS